MAMEFMSTKNGGKGGAHYWEEMSEFSGNNI